MKIEDSGLLSLLSANGLNDFKQSLMEDVDNAEDFAVTLLGEIRQLREQGGIDALWGNQLPVHGQEVAIDMAHTLSVLQEVMNHIAAATEGIGREMSKDLSVEINNALQSFITPTNSEGRIINETGQNLQQTLLDAEENVVNELIGQAGELKKQDVAELAFQRFGGDKILDSTLEGMNEILHPVLKATAEGNQIIRQNILELSAELPGMSKPFGHPEWGGELGERILWMQSRNVPNAELRLNPPDLGPVSIRVEVNQDQASVKFVVYHVAVRDAIEAAIPKLREMLESQQLNLADFNVSDGSSSDSRFSPHAGHTNDNTGMAGFSDEGHGFPPAGFSDKSEQSDETPSSISNGILSIYV